MRCRIDLLVKGGGNCRRDEGAADQFDLPRRPRHHVRLRLPSSTHTHTYSTEGDPSRARSRVPVRRRLSLSLTHTHSRGDLYCIDIGRQICVREIMSGEPPRDRLKSCPGQACAYGSHTRAGAPGCKHLHKQTHTSSHRKLHTQ